MSLYLNELSDLERLLSLSQSVSREEWDACLAQIRGLAQFQEGAMAEMVGHLLKMGPTHLEAIREFKRKEQDKGCIPAYFRDLCPV